MDEDVLGVQHGLRVLLHRGGAEERDVNNLEVVVEEGRAVPTLQPRGRQSRGGQVVPQVLVETDGDVLLVTREEVVAVVRPAGLQGLEGVRRVGRAGDRGVRVQPHVVLQGTHLRQLEDRRRPELAHHRVGQPRALHALEAAELRRRHEPLRHVHEAHEGPPVPPEGVPTLGGVEACRAGRVERQVVHDEDGGAPRREPAARAQAAQQARERAQTGEGVHPRQHQDRRGGRDGDRTRRAEERPRVPALDGVVQAIAAGAVRLRAAAPAHERLAAGRLAVRIALGLARKGVPEATAAPPVLAPGAEQLLLSDRTHGCLPGLPPNLVQRRLRPWGPHPPVEGLPAVGLPM
mmetsp:Transcript_131774/g.409634  ORF Transcript_131774/g.409634 Transcript_131774/m.409634 type:complete len:348 (-) Transcript_131774:381-1424(-)